MQFESNVYNNGLPLRGSKSSATVNEAAKEVGLKKKLNNSKWQAPVAAGVTDVNADRLAKAFVSLIPHMMGSLRRHLRTAEGGDLRVGQFRMMMAIAISPDLSISDAAEVMGDAEARVARPVQQAQQLGMLRGHRVLPRQLRQPAPCIEPQQRRGVQHHARSGAMLV